MYVPSFWPEERLLGLIAGASGLTETLGGAVFRALSDDHTTTWHAFVDSACIVIGISAGL